MDRELGSLALDDEVTELILFAQSKEMLVVGGERLQPGERLIAYRWRDLARSIEAVWLRFISFEVEDAIIAESWGEINTNNA